MDGPGTVRARSVWCGSSTGRLGGATAYLRTRLRAPPLHLDVLRPLTIPVAQGNCILAKLLTSTATYQALSLHQGASVWSDAWQLVTAWGLEVRSLVHQRSRGRGSGGFPLPPLQSSFLVGLPSKSTKTTHARHSREYVKHSLYHARLIGQLARTGRNPYAHDLRE